MSFVTKLTLDGLIDRSNVAIVFRGLGGVRLCAAVTLSSSSTSPVSIQGRSGLLHAFACWAIWGCCFDTLGHVADLNEQPPNLPRRPPGSAQLELEGGKKYVKTVAEMAVDDTAPYAKVNLQDSSLVKYLVAQPVSGLSGCFSRQALAVHRIYLA